MCDCILCYTIFTRKNNSIIRNRDNWMPWLYSIQGIRGVPYPIYQSFYQSSFIIYFHISKSNYVLLTQQRSWKRVLYYYYVSLTLCSTSKESAAIITYYRHSNAHGSVCCIIMWQRCAKIYIGLYLSRYFGLRRRTSWYDYYYESDTVIESTFVTDSSTKEEEEFSAITTDEFSAITTDESSTTTSTEEDQRAE